MIRNFAVTIFGLLICVSLNAAELKPYKGNLADPGFQLTDLHGQTHDLKNYRGKVVLLNFWATWCPPCIEELPSLQRLQQHYVNQDVSILTVDVGEPPELVTSFLKKVDAEQLNVLMDSDAKAHGQWNIYVFPTTFLLDKTGKIQYGAVGALEWDSPTVLGIIEKLKDKH